jgi:outer membrane protein insertion porin family
MIFTFFVSSETFANNLNKIKILGNQRISDNTIKTFLPVKIGDSITDKLINDTTKTLYETNFFKNIDVEFENNELIISVIENPIIQNITYNGIKSETLKNKILNGIKIINRSSYVELFVKNDIDLMLNNLKQEGYYFSKIISKIKILENNKINLIYEIDLGQKAKIKKISFLGNKVFKDKKLKSIILSEEYKFWKFLSGKKYLNENLVNFDARLLRNYFLNNGYYNVDITSSFARIINNDEFELIFNINAGEKIFFGELNIDLPINYEEENFRKLTKTLTKLSGEPYSINSIEKITEQIDLLALNEQYETIDINVLEELNGNQLNLIFKIKESEKNLVKKINILGNNITRENVIRNQFEIDEGDLFNEILYNKTINNIKSLNFFKDVSANLSSDPNNGDKTIDIIVEEKATGEIGASAGVGTSGESIGIFLKEKNYLGKGLNVGGDLVLSTDSIKGSFSIRNPNFNDTNKTVYASIQAVETDKLSIAGYKTNSTGFLYGTNFEIFDDLTFGIGNKNFYENIEVDDTASLLQKKQEGDYWDSFINLDFTYDKRNQRFRPSDGFLNSYSIDLPIISDTNTLTNTFDYKFFEELYENNVTTLGIFLKSSNSITNENIKLTERNYLPSSKLRGFEAGSVGPKDGNDYIGGNYVGSLNIATTIPQFLEESQNIDFSIFYDAANVWGVDYDSSLDSTNKVRSSIGLGIDWLTAVGPLNFTFSHPITKADGDKTESFRFNLGTTF